MEFGSVRHNGILFEQRITIFKALYATGIILGSNGYNAGTMVMNGALYFQVLKTGDLPYKERREN